mmetsp:Transcript_24555/g.79387  ORF Transcript_24555/g.79387 Transcript_24555/m.79387 type:complete len:334 (-) Transcript_24555:636-1637(-)
MNVANDSGKAIGEKHSAVTAESMVLCGALERWDGCQDLFFQEVQDDDVAEFARHDEAGAEELESDDTSACGETWSEAAVGARVEVERRDEVERPGAVGVDDGGASGGVRGREVSVGTHEAAVGDQLLNLKKAIRRRTRRRVREGGRRRRDPKPAFCRQRHHHHRGTLLILDSHVQGPAGIVVVVGLGPCDGHDVRREGHVVVVPLEPEERLARVLEVPPDVKTTVVVKGEGVAARRHAEDEARRSTKLPLCFERDVAAFVDVVDQESAPGDLAVWIPLVMGTGADDEPSTPRGYRVPEGRGILRELTLAPVEDVQASGSLQVPELIVQGVDGI